MDFSEKFYLAANPDVAAAVAKGGFRSGLHHYEQYGRREGRLPCNAAPLVFFVHIPKTAGSAVNASLKARRHNGIDHCENLDPVAFAQAANLLDWLSGHMPGEIALAKLREATDRPVRMFSCVREPTAQVASHYNWLIEIHARGGAFYDGHPEPMKELSEKVRTAGASVDGIMAILAAHPGIFLNLQSRVLGDLSAYEAIGIGSSLDDLVTGILGEPATVGRENASRYHIDPAVFRSPEMAAFLRERNARDEELFASMQASRPGA